MREFVGSSHYHRIACRLNDCDSCRHRKVGEKVRPGILTDGQVGNFRAPGNVVAIVSHNFKVEQVFFDDTGRRRRGCGRAGVLGRLAICVESARLERARGGRG